MFSSVASSTSSRVSAGGFAALVLCARARWWRRAFLCLLGFFFGFGRVAGRGGGVARLLLVSLGLLLRLRPRRGPRRRVVAPRVVHEARAGRLLRRARARVRH